MLSAYHMSLQGQCCELVVLQLVWSAFSDVIQKENRGLSDCLNSLNGQVFPSAPSFSPLMIQTCSEMTMREQFGEHYMSISPQSRISPH